MTTRLQVLNPSNPSVPLPHKNIQKNPMKKIVLGVSTILYKILYNIQ